MNLNDLPNEVLCQVFNNLDLYELKLASRVCTRWSTLTFSGKIMDRVFLKPRYSDSDVLSNIKRNYRKIRQQWETDKDDEFSSLVCLQDKLKHSVRVLDILSKLTSEQLRLLLLVAPEVQHLSFGVIHDCYPGTNAPFPVLPKLTSLKLVYARDDLVDFFHKSMPNLQSLNMNCASEFELGVWKHLCGQLKFAHVDEFISEYINPFLEQTFPLLEDLSVNNVVWLMRVELVPGRSHAFFQMHPLLRKLSFRFPLECVESITSHCPELTYLHLNLKDPEEGFLNSLVQLTKLKHLSIDGPQYPDAATDRFMEMLAQLTGQRHLSPQGEINRKILRGPLKSLEFVELNVRRPGVLLENIFEVAPQLKCLKIYRGQHDLLQLQFICENFSYLQHLEVNVKEVIAADNSVRFDELAHLQELTLWGLSNMHYIHRNNVRCLTMRDSTIKDDELKQIPEKFPLLKRLVLKECLASLAGVERLHKLMPSCRIEYRKERFYPIDNSTSN